MKISIITVTLNCASVINDCLSSVSAQKYDDIEHIIVDGGSTDGTLILLKSKRNHLAALISEIDEGIYYAMNKGIKIATGDIIGFLNSDDFYIDDNVLSRVASVFINNPSLDACYADLIYVDPIDTTKIIRYWKSGNFKSGLFSKGWCPPHPTFFVRNSVYKRFGKFNLNYNISSDRELMMRLLEIHKINVCYIPELWVKMRVGGLSNKSLRTILIQNLEDLYALKEHNLPKNIFLFLANKFFSRLKQFFHRPGN
ncbi:WcaA Glycosyltransferases involved in cell wall biogenesis [Candidatus Pelagibacterales bacterium]